MGLLISGIVQDNPKKRSVKFWEIFIFRFVSTTIMLLAYFIYCIFFAENKMIAIIQSLYIISVVFDISWFFQGLEDFKKIATRNFIVKIINIVYMFACIKCANDLWKYVLGLAFFNFIGSAVMCINLRKYIVKVKMKDLKPFKDSKCIFQLFIPTIATQVYELIDKTMIGGITGMDAENGYYEQAAKIIRMSVIVITTMSTVMIPKISKDFSSKNYQKVKQNITKSYSFVWFLGIPMMLGIIGISNVLVPVFFGEGYEKVKILLPILSCLFISMGFNSINGNQYLIATGQQNKYTKMLMFGGMVNIILNAILIPSLYSIGAAVASVVGEFVIMILGFLYLDKTNQYRMKDVIRISYKYVISGSIMILVIIVLTKILQGSLLRVCIIIAIGMACYCLSLHLLKDNLIIEIEGIVVKKLKVNRKGEIKN